jgi:hypothetical protein
MTEVLDKEVEKGICADAPDGLSAFRQFGRIFATTMPQLVSKGEMQAGDDAVAGARLEL